MLKATFVSDFSNFTDAVKKAELDLKGMEIGAGKVQAKFNAMADSFSGRKIIQEANLAVEAIERLGGASTLTAREQARVNSTISDALAKYRAFGEQAPKAMIDLEQATRKVQVAAGGVFGDLTNQVKSMALGFVSAQAIIGTVQGVFGTLTQFISGSIQSYASAEAAAKKMTTALQAQGTATPAVIKQYNDLATQFQKTTVYSDDLVNEMQGLLTSVGDVMPGQMDKALTAATDLASGLGIDLRTATIMVAKASEENVGALKKAGVALDETRVKGEGMSYILGEIEKKFGGQAQAEIDTYAGRVKQLGNAWDNVKESVGGAILQDPVFVAGLRQVKEAAEGASDGGNLVTAAWNAFKTASPEWLKSMGAMHHDLKGIADDANAMAEATDRMNAMAARAPKPQTAAPFSFGKLMEDAAVTSKALIDQWKKEDEAAIRHAETIKKLGETFRGLDVIGKASDALKAYHQAEAAGVPLGKMTADQQIAIAKTMEDAIEVYQAAGKIAPAEMGKIASAARTLSGTVSESAKNAAEIAAVWSKAQEKMGDASDKFISKWVSDSQKAAQKVADASAASLGKQITENEKYQSRVSEIGMSASALQLKHIDDAREKEIRSLGIRTVQNALFWDKNKALIDAYYDHQEDIANGTFDTIEERMRRSGVLTKGELQSLADAAKRDYGQMLKDGNYTWDELATASKKSMALQVAAMEGLGGAITQALYGGLGGLADGLSAAITGNGSVGKAFADYGTGVAKDFTQTALAMIPGIGPILSEFAGPIIDGLKKMFGSIFGIGTAGRDKVLDFASSKGGFDSLHAQLLTLGAEGEKLWINLTQGVGRNNPAEAAKAIEAVTAALGRTPSAMAESSGYKTIAELKLVADQAKKTYEYMKDSGLYTASAISDAFEKSKDAQLAALGQTKAEMVKLTDLMGSLQDDERQALESGYKSALAEGFKGSQEAFFQQQLEFYNTLKEGDTRLKTYFYGSTVDSWKLLAAGQGDVLDTIAAKYKETFDKLGSEYKSLSDSVNKEAAEEFMGVVETQERARMAQIEAERAGLQAKKDEELHNAAESFGAMFEAGQQVDSELRELFGKPLEIPYSFRQQGPGPGGYVEPPDVPSFREGSQGKYLNFGAGTLAMLHGRERVMTEGESTAGGSGRPIIVQLVAEGRTLAEVTVPYIPDVVQGYGLA